MKIKCPHNEDKWNSARNRKTLLVSTITEMFSDDIKIIFLDIVTKYCYSFLFLSQESLFVGTFFFLQWKTKLCRKKSWGKEKFVTTSRKHFLGIRYSFRGSSKISLIIVRFQCFSSGIVVTEQPMKFHWFWLSVKGTDFQGIKRWTYEKFSLKDETRKNRDQWFSKAYSGHIFY